MIMLISSILRRLEKCDEDDDNGALGRDVSDRRDASDAYGTDDDDSSDDDDDDDGDDGGYDHYGDGDDDDDDGASPAQPHNLSVLVHVPRCSPLQATFAAQVKPNSRPHSQATIRGSS